MPLPDSFFLFQNGRIVHATLNMRDLGDQDSMIRSISSRAPIPVPEMVLPGLEPWFMNEIEFGVCDTPQAAPQMRKFTILDTKRKPNFAVTERQFVCVLPINVLPLVSTFIPHSFAEPTGNFRGLRQLGSRGHTLAIEDTLHAILPANTWFIIVLAHNGKDWVLQDLLLEVHDKKNKLVRTPRMINIFDNGRICVGTLNRFLHKDRGEAACIIFKEFMHSFWNDHLVSNPQQYWLRWDLNGNYIMPTVDQANWCSTTGSTYSPLVP